MGENIDSYRLINKLSVIDNIIKKFIKDKIIRFVDENNIISDGHHGSMRDQSTMT